MHSEEETLLELRDDHAEKLPVQSVAECGHDSRERRRRLLQTLENPAREFVLRGNRVDRLLVDELLQRERCVESEVMISVRIPRNKIP